MAAYKIRGRYIFFIDVKNKRGKFACEEFIDENDVITGQMVGKEPYGDVYLMQMKCRRSSHIVCINVYSQLLDKGYDILKYIKRYL